MSSMGAEGMRKVCWFFHISLPPVGGLAGLATHCRFVRLCCFPPGFSRAETLAGLPRHRAFSCGLDSTVSLCLPFRGGVAHSRNLVYTALALFCRFAYALSGVCLYWQAGVGSRFVRYWNHIKFL
uniref:Uncharacterized protein n=1 Tax=Desulfovibrio desulfuricans (strain ATCC 27774 / DSM 6949 / MB) TaxID=525146 RepID=B8J2L4_DESDA